MYTNDKFYKFSASCSGHVLVTSFIFHLCFKLSDELLFKFQCLFKVAKVIIYLHII